jgi:hypothetical protein
VARSKYIYLVYYDTVVLVAFTVKYEAHKWLAESCWEPKDVQLVRMRDGDEGGVAADWDQELLDCFTPVRCQQDH